MTKISSRIHKNFGGFYKESESEWILSGNGPFKSMIKIMPDNH